MRKIDTVKKHAEGNTQGPLAIWWSSNTSLSTSRNKKKLFEHACFISFDVYTIL